MAATRTMAASPLTLEQLRQMHDRALQRVHLYEQHLEQAIEHQRQLEARLGKARELVYHLAGTIAHLAVGDEPAKEETCDEAKECYSRTC